MRASRVTHIIRDEDGAPWCVFLEGDSNKSHQYGIDRLLRQMGIEPQGNYVAGRSMSGPRTLVERHVNINRTYALANNRQKRVRDKIFLLTSPDLDPETQTARLSHIVRQDIGTEITSAWNGREFKLAGWTPEAHAALSEIAAAAELGDLTIFNGTPRGYIDPRHHHAGLNICITSMMPSQVRDQIDADDKDAEKLAVAAQECGIIERIKEAPNIGYHALVPHWRFDTVLRRGKEASVSTDHPVMFFLNPEKQEENNHGWYTVEELDQWIAGFGPIPKVRENA